jgi:hypothetical protein
MTARTSAHLSFELDELFEELRSLSGEDACGQSYEGQRAAVDLIVRAAPISAWRMARLTVDLALEVFLGDRSIDHRRTVAGGAGDEFYRIVGSDGQEIR